MRNRKVWLFVAYWFCAAVVFASFYLRLPVLWDVDSYYHLAVARHYVEHGIFAPIPWLRYSLLSSGADKEFLFHILLMPFAALPDAAIGGRIALAFFNASIATAIAGIAYRAIGGAAFVLPLWLFVAAPPFLARAMRLRPELLALLIILVAIPVAARRRHGFLALLAFAFASGYTAFHVFIALVIAWEAWRWLETRRLELRPVALALLGVAAGLLVRPHPIANLRLWYVQNVLFFFNVHRLDVGPEIFPPVWDETLLRSSMWIATLVLLLFLARRNAAPDRDRVLLAFAAITAALFLLLFLRMARMSTYAYPLMTVTAMLALWRRVPSRLAAAILAASALISVPLVVDKGVRDVVMRYAAAASELDWFAFGKAVPRGARVAAHWASTEAYVFWAPQGRYLNALDPLFMALPHPREYDAQKRIFSGAEPDIAASLTRDLDSDHLALDWTIAAPLLVERLRGDPRIVPVYGGYNALFRVRPVPGIEYVDVRAMLRNDCASFRKTLTLAAARRVTFSFAPYGRAVLSVDGVERARIDRPPLALLSRAASIDVDLAAGDHTIDIRTCREDEHAGFYLGAQ